jgi:hypothetical protein
VVQNDQLRTLLHGIVERTVGNSQKISNEIAHWFDSAMDRVSGAYKRWSQLVSFIVAVLLVIVLNISAIHVAQRLSKQSIDTKVISQVKAEDAKKALAELENLSPDIGGQNLDDVRTFFSRSLFGSLTSGRGYWVR